MIRWSFQFAHGCEPVAPSASPSGSTRPTSWSRRSAISRGHVRERVDLAGLDLGLGRDQLAGEVALGLGAGRGGLHVLEAVDEVERDGVEQRELFLDCDGEVGGLLEALTGVSEKLICWNALLVAHGA